MKNLLYFAYGSNLFEERMKYRVGRLGPVVKHGLFTLENYKLVFNCGLSKLKAFANIIPSPGDKVDGLLYEVNQAQVHELNYWEGYPRNYEHFFVDGPGGNLVYGYWSVRKFFALEEGALPELWYLNLLIEGSIENHMERLYKELVAFKLKNYKLKKGSKHKL